VANLAAAAAANADPNHVRTLMRGAEHLLTSPDAQVADAWRNKPPVARLENLAWITGRLPGDSAAVSQGFPDASDLPITVGFEPDPAGQVNPDVARMAIWKELLEDRALLAGGDFQQFDARMNAAASQSPDDRKFLADARREMLQGTAAVLSSYADRLKLAPGGQAYRASLLRLLRTDAFPLQTRLNAGSQQVFGVSFAWVALVVGVLELLLLFLVSVAASILVGYARAFPSRHFGDPKRAGLSNDAPASGATA
jgi:hypothetical protein